VDGRRPGLHPARPRNRALRLLGGPRPRRGEEEDPLEIAEKCSGEGLREARIDITIETTPAISG
jgi:hypothetical protein